MFTIQVLDNIAAKILKQFDMEKYQLGPEINDPDVILVRSHKLHDHAFSGHLKAVGRAGVGTDNIPVAELTEMGIPVFYAPGANANAVKELVLASILIGYRHLEKARTFLGCIEHENKELMSREIESGKKQFVGHEIAGKTLGVVGLGNIGVRVANAALALGMKVIVYDPKMTLPNALAMMPGIEKLSDLNTLLRHADIITLHVPLNADTTNLINKENIHLIKHKALLLNFSREQVVNEEAILESLNKDHLVGFITDFPTPKLAEHPRVLGFPHLGASTVEAEENSAEMVTRNIRNFLELGTIDYAINFPSISLPMLIGVESKRLVIINQNKPGAIADITQAISKQKGNIEEMVNASLDTIAVNLIDVSGCNEKLDQLLSYLKELPSVMRIHVIG